MCEGCVVVSHVRQSCPSQPEERTEPASTMRETSYLRGSVPLRHLEIFLFYANVFMFLYLWPKICVCVRAWLCVISRLVGTTQKQKVHREKEILYKFIVQSAWYETLFCSRVHVKRRYFVFLFLFFFKPFTKNTWMVWFIQSAGCLVAASNNSS